MNKEFVTYNQSLALKELGFDEPCFSFYIDTDKFLYTNQKWLDYNLNSRRISAPLYQQAFRWFREVHGLYPEVHSIVLVYGNEIVFNAHINHLPKDESIGCFLGKYETYEEAESACLDKLIEIVKNK